MNYMKYSSEVKSAIKSGKPIVALESTIISHGFPYPQNVELAQKVESIIRQQGVVPATVALIKGNICVGLNDTEIELLGQSTTAFKTSIHDIPRILSSKR